MFHCRCRVETITYRYPDGNFTRQPYYHLCDRSDGTNPCPEARHYDLGEKVLVPADSNTDNMKPPKQTGNRFVRSNSTSHPSNYRTDNLTSHKKLRPNKDQLYVSTSNREEETRGSSSTKQFSPQPISKGTGSPVTLSQPHPPVSGRANSKYTPLSPRQPTGRSEAMKITDSKDDVPMSRRDSVSKRHSQHSRNASGTHKSTGDMTGYEPKSPSARRRSTLSSPIAPRHDEESNTIETSKDPESSRHDYRAQVREKHRKDAHESRQAELERENKGLRSIIAQLEEDNRKRKSRESYDKDELDDLRKRVQRIELGLSPDHESNNESGRKTDTQRKTAEAKRYITETRSPGGSRGNYRQEMHHTDEKGRVTISERVRPRRSGDSSTPVTKPSDEHTNPSSARTLRSGGWTISREASSNGSVIEDETQSESEDDEKSNRTKHKGKHRKRRHHH